MTGSSGRRGRGREVEERREEQVLGKGKEWDREGEGRKVLTVEVK